MRINVNKNRGLELVGEIENDENKEYWLLIKVEPTGIETPSSQSEETKIKVAVHDGMARVVSKDVVDYYFSKNIENPAD